jgi:dTDP-glucose pyrophosphorylase
MIGIIPAAGAGLRIQPLGCSKELLPVGTRLVDGIARPKAVSEYLVERMIAAGARQICMVISAEKSDIVRYYAERDYAAEIFYAVQRRPRGLCDALFRAVSFVRSDEPVLIGLPDTIWFPENAFLTAVDALSQGDSRPSDSAHGGHGEHGYGYGEHGHGEPAAEVNLVLFPVDTPSVFDAVLCDAVPSLPNEGRSGAPERRRVERVVVKQLNPGSNWVWGAVVTSGRAFHALHQLWESRHRADEFLGDLLNAYIAAGNPVQATANGEHYMDVGTMEGYHAAQDYLRERNRQAGESRAAAA